MMLRICAGHGSVETHWKDLHPPSELHKMNGGAQEPHQAITQDYPSSYPQSFSQSQQLSSRPPSQPPPPVLASSQRIQQHQALNPANPPAPPPYPAYPTPHPQQFSNFPMAAVAPNQPNFQSHPSPQQLPIPNYNNPGHVYAKASPVPHQPSPNPPAPPMGRPSQHQVAQHLMNPQALARSQRMHQQQQMLNQQRQDEQMMTCDPLDFFTVRNSALRRYTNNHVHMNSVVGTHWTVNQLLREDHIHLVSKRKSVDPSPPDSVQQRKERLKQKITQIEHDIKTSEIIHQAQLDRIQSA
ncbi:hypothetical protein MJO28_001579 [Puccinia striiformis f. sp. tritici]|uniref:Uncharacterized protein n=1 Tax=Puccinia striiformis f. sp. tritici TaxID=168172 RepID=A0ACC0EW46_9BASI|nr:hypothetical protein MJO28_001579 [Puccinia striiformis f. sp. tritici]